MEKNSKFYVCHVDNCRFNREGSCHTDTDCVTIAFYDGAAICPNFEQTKLHHLDSQRQSLANALLAEVKRIYFDVYGGADLEEDLEVDLSQCELCTDKDYNCFMIAKGSTCLQDFICDEGVAALVDAYNTVISGKPSIATFQE